MKTNGRRMLIALAHPDDESFGMAGTIVRYGREGAAVHLICATNGDVGTADEEYLEGHETVASLRLAELRCAAQILGLAGLYELGYRDSGMQGSPDNEHPDSLVAAPLEQVVGRVTALIREVRPQVVVTFDPFGGYGHPDHIRMHEATVAAFAAASDPARFPDQIAGGLEPYHPQKLYYLTFDRRWLRLMLQLLPLFGRDPRRFGRNGDIDLVEIADHTYPIHARIDTRAYTELARQASECHASQMGGFGQPGLMQRIRELLETKDDTYMRAIPPADGRLRERDLFAGVVID